MTHEDLGQIKSLIHTELGEAVENVILPAVEKLTRSIVQQEVKEIKEDVKGLKEDVAHIKNHYPDKHYLDDRINELRGDIISWRKHDGARLDQLIAFQHKKGHLAKDEVVVLDDMRGFAPLPV